MGDDEMEFKDEKSIRGAKAIADKADMGYVMTRVSEKGWQMIVPTLKQAIREGTIDRDILDNPPTHVLDIYKMRRGRFKNVRIWLNLHLGTGYRQDLFITDANNHPITNDTKMEIYTPSKELEIDWEGESK